jgi:hypothetical protein
MRIYGELKKVKPIFAGSQNSEVTSRVAAKWDLIRRRDNQLK